MCMVLQIPLVTFDGLMWSSPKYTNLLPRQQKTMLMAMFLHKKSIPKDVVCQVRFFLTPTKESSAAHTHTNARTNARTNAPTHTRTLTHTHK